MLPAALGHRAAPQQWGRGGMLEPPDPTCPPAGDACVEPAAGSAGIQARAIYYLFI